MNKNTSTTIKLEKGEIGVYDFGETKLYAYKTNDFIDDEVFVVAKNGKGVVVELPCFFDNIKELTAWLEKENIKVEAKMVAYHAAGASFLPEVPAYGTKSSVEYNTNGGGAGLISNFTQAFGEIFDSSKCNAENILSDGDVEIAGIKMNIKSNGEAYDISFPEINCVYTHMMGHDCHSIVAGWHAAYERYGKFLRENSNGKILFLELGVGYNTPGIIKYPFIKLTADLPDAYYITVNKETYIPPAIKKKSTAFSSDIGELLTNGSVSDII